MRKINGVYFDEVSKDVDEWLTTYLDFDDVDVSIKKLDDTLSLIIAYQGRGSYLLPNGKHASARFDYNWSVSLVGVDTGEVIFDDEHKDVSISIHKTRIFDKRKIVVRDNRKHKVLTLYAKKVTLDKVITQDAIAREYFEKQNQASGIGPLVTMPQEKESTNAHKTTSKFGDALFLIVEIALVAGISYILHKFLYGHMTAVETLFIYGLLGFLISDTLDNKIERIFAVLVAIAFLSVLPYTIFTIGILLLYWFVFRKPIKAKLNAKK